TFTVTPLGTGIGFLPIRDISVSPDVAENFTADAGLDRFAARHDAVRRGQDARAEAAHDLRHVIPTEIHASAGPAHPGNPGDDLLAARAVLQRDPDDGARGIHGLHHLESLDVALALEDARDLHLQAGRRHINTRVPRVHRVPESGQHICD